jgi:hypothetical protein
MKKQNTYKNCLAFDLGKQYGWCFKDKTSEEFGEGTVVDLTDWGKQFFALLDKWKPEIVVISQTNHFGFWNASRQMLMKTGVAFYICGKKGIPGVELSDIQARKLCFGKGIKKIEVQKLFPKFKKIPNALDALVLARGWLLLTK